MKATRNSIPAWPQTPHSSDSSGAPGASASALTASTHAHSRPAAASNGGSFLTAQPRPRTASAPVTVAAASCTGAAQQMRKGKTRTWIAQNTPYSQTCLATARAGMSAAQCVPCAAATSVMMRRW
jgi:hypothetical protein